MTNLLRTLRPYAPHAIPHKDCKLADWQRFLAAWVDPDPAYSCPKCGGGMRRRKGKRGVFLGCPRYPECKGTRAAPPIIPPGQLPPFTPAERAWFAERAKAKRATKAKAAKEAEAEEAARLKWLELVIQLPVEGFDYGKEWGELWTVGEELQARVDKALREWREKFSDG